MDATHQPIPPVYRIQTERLIIRCWQPQDAPLQKQAVDASREHLKPWMPWARGEPEALQYHLDRMRSWRGKFDLEQDFVYGIFDLTETRVLGGTGLHTRLGVGAREIGYWIHADFINQGFATETAAALTKIAFEILKLNRVEIHCDPQNVRSAAVPKKLGYTLDAILRGRVELGDGVWRDAMVWSLFADAYPASPAARAKISAFDAIGAPFQLST